MGREIRYICIYIHVYIHTYICVCIYIYIFVCMCVSVCLTSACLSNLPRYLSVRPSVCLSLHITLIGRKISEQQTATNLECYRRGLIQCTPSTCLTIWLEWPRRSMKTLSADSLCPASRRLIRSRAATFRPMFVPTWPLHVWPNGRHDSCCILGRSNMLLTYRAVASPERPQISVTLHDVPSRKTLSCVCLL
jgi:hypothetical protein